MKYPPTSSHRTEIMGYIAGRPWFRYVCALVTIFHIPALCLSDPAPVQDICVADLVNGHATPGGYSCKPLVDVTSDDFFFGELAYETNITQPWDLGLNRVTFHNFPGLNTIGLSVIRADLVRGGIIPLHFHQRADELITILRGRVLVGFVTSAGRFFSKVLRKGEIFVVPRGLMHFQQNVGAGKATILPVFNSMNPGLSIAPNVLFGTSPELPTSLLAKTFLMDEGLVEGLKAKFGAKEA